VKLITDCFQNEANEWDISRIMWAITIVGFLINAGIAVFSSHQFSAQDFGLGGAALLGGGGLGTMWHGKAP
jgi:hypothetical protein